MRRLPHPHSPPWPAIPSPTLEIEQAFIFSINITLPLVSHRWKSQGDDRNGEGNL